MVNLLPYVYLSLALTVILFAVFIAVGFAGSPADVFFLLGSLVSGGATYILFRKYKENKEARRH